jgi:TonB-linked SusC/RagA family outer membrane protein
MKDLSVKGSYTYMYQGYHRFIHQPLVYLNDLNGKPYLIFDLLPPSQVYKRFDNLYYQKADIYVTWQKTLRNHAFTVMAGHNRESGSTNSLNATKQDLITDAVPSISTAIGRITNGDDVSAWATMGYFGRITYNYKEKYLLELDGRYDGSYKFRKKDRWGFFPSASLGYRISEEAFWKTFKQWLPYLKLRASYGTLGDQNGAAYSYLATMGITPEISWIGADGRPATVGMPAILSESLTWETLTTKNLGFDAALLNSRLNVAFDIYRKDRTDIVTAGKPLPSTLGASTPQVNGNALKTTGWEWTLAWNDRVNRDFSYNISFNLSDYIATITKTENPTNNLNYDYIGKRIGEIWGFESDGLFQSTEEISAAPSQSKIYGAWVPGDVRYKDLNNDGEISRGDNSLENHGDRKVIGNSVPRLYYGIRMGATWKDFDFSMFWSGVGKGDIWFASSVNMFWGIVGGQSLWQSSGFKPHLDYWRPDNTDAYFHIPSTNPNRNREISSRYLQSRAYLRLKNIQASYQLPRFLLEKVSVRNAKLFISCENLITFDRLPEAFDPEALAGARGLGKILPLSKSISAGLSVTL